jgi:hypothetical protein
VHDADETDSVYRLGKEKAMAVPKDVVKYFIPLLDRWAKEKEAATQLAQSYEGEGNRNLFLKTQYDTAARTYKACIEDLSKVLYR